MQGSTQRVRVDCGSVLPWVPLVLGCLLPKGGFSQPGGCFVSHPPWQLYSTNSSNYTEHRILYVFLELSFLMFQWSRKTNGNFDWTGQRGDVSSSFASARKTCQSVFFLFRNDVAEFGVLRPESCCWSSFSVADSSVTNPTLTQTGSKAWCVSLFRVLAEFCQNNKSWRYYTSLVLSSFGSIWSCFSGIFFFFFNFSEN